MSVPAPSFAVTHRSILAIALPMTLAYLTTPLVGVVNLGVVGQLGDPAVVGGVSIGGLVFDMVFLTFNFLRSGTTGLVAQAVGAGDRTEIAASFWRALVLGLGIGLVVLALQGPLIDVSLRLIGGSPAVQSATLEYWNVRVLAAPLSLANYVVLGWLIGLGRAAYGLLLQIVLNGLNIVLSILFVHRLDMGVAGVGWASAVAETVTALVGLGLALRLMGGEARVARARLFARAAFVRMVAVNRDIMIRTFAILFAFTFFTAQCARSGDVVLAANEILMNLVAFAAYFLDGFAAAAEQLTGRAIGAREPAAFRRAVFLTIVWGYAVGLLATLVFWLAGPAIIDWMTTSEAVRATGREYLVFAAVVPLVGTLAYQMDGVFIGATWSVDMRNMMLVSLAAYLVAWWALYPVLGVTGLWLAVLVFLGLRGLTLLWRTPKRIAAAFAA